MSFAWGARRCGGGGEGEGVGPKVYRTVMSDAERRMPRIARRRLVCQRVCVSQCAVETVVQEKAPITAAARTVHWGR